jgi:hypothetical protein
LSKRIAHGEIRAGVRREVAYYARGIVIMTHHDWSRTTYLNSKKKLRRSRISTRANPNPANRDHNRISYSLTHSAHDQCDGASKMIKKLTRTAQKRGALCKFGSAHNTAASIRIRYHTQEEQRYHTQGEREQELTFQPQHTPGTAARNNKPMRICGVRTSLYEIVLGYMERR